MGHSMSHIYHALPRTQGLLIRLEAPRHAVVSHSNRHYIKERVVSTPIATPTSFPFRTTDVPTYWTCIWKPHIPACAHGLCARSILAPPISPPLTTPAMTKSMLPPMPTRLATAMFERAYAYFHATPLSIPAPRPWHVCAHADTLGFTKKLKTWILPGVYTKLKKMVKYPNRFVTDCRPFVD